MSYLVLEIFHNALLLLLLFWLIIMTFWFSKKRKIIRIYLVLEMLENVLQSKHAAWFFFLVSQLKWFTDFLIKNKKKSNFILLMQILCKHTIHFEPYQNIPSLPWILKKDRWLSFDVKSQLIIIKKNFRVMMR